ncbi:hypothetical protein M427DRAFT_98622, partial [Gonapodya prolifera JEL478]
HSSLQNVVKCAFGILKQCFAALRTMMEYSVVTQHDIFIAAVVLHNFILCHDPAKVACPNGPHLPTRHHCTSETHHTQRTVHPAHSQFLSRCCLYSHDTTPAVGAFHVEEPPATGWGFKSNI